VKSPLQRNAGRPLAIVIVARFDGSRPGVRMTPAYPISAVPIDGAIPRHGQFHGESFTFAGLPFALLPARLVAWVLGGVAIGARHDAQKHSVVA
jgi:hypothetical protein